MSDKVISLLGLNCEETGGEANRFWKSGCMHEKQLSAFVAVRQPEA